MTPDSPHIISRRDALKTMGAGAALLSVGAMSLTTFAAETPRVAGTPGASSTGQPFTLPKLDYAYDALEPHIDARTMEIHHTKHHQGYINNANNALAGHAALRGLSAEALLADLLAVPESIRTTVRNNVGGHVNHAFFWKVIGPAGSEGPRGELGNAIAASFGSFAGFQKEFADAAAKRFGSGWAWLIVRDGKLAVHSTANQDSPLSEGAVPVLGLDVWEHAYYLNYQNRRADYVTAFWNVVNWEQVAKNYRATRAG